ncbi:MAG: tRNA (N6-isopentenyl adenosine(37)-C2)-methylthiotransferase MiaB, partial [Caldisericia bacterium]
MKIKIFIKTFGCKVNQYDSELIRENLIMDPNFELVDNYLKADLFIINSCFVTEKAEKDVIKEIKRFLKLGKVIIT